jgi:hypothetical protein
MSCSATACCGIASLASLSLLSCAAWSPGSIRGGYHGHKLQELQAAVCILLTIEVCSRLEVPGIGSSEKDSRSLARKPGHMNLSAWSASSFRIISVYAWLEILTGTCSKIDSRRCMAESRRRRRRRVRPSGLPPWRLAQQTTPRTSLTCSRRQANAFTLASFALRTPRSYPLSTAEHRGGKQPRLTLAQHVCACRSALIVAVAVGSLPETP